MNFDGIESHLVADLRRTLGKRVGLVAGPAVTPPLGGMEPTVFVHAARYEDAGGVTVDGAHIGRRQVREGRFSGVAEERPGRILVEITCAATAYSTVKDLSTLIAPSCLRALSVVREFPAGQLANRSVRMTFADFTASLARAETYVKEERDLRYHCQHLLFHLDGFLHTWITASGGLKSAVRRPAEPPVKRKKKAKKQVTPSPKGGGT